MMARLMRKIALFSLKVIVLLFTISLALLYYFGETHSGLQRTIKIASYLLPGLQIENANGRLFSEFTLNHVSFHNTDYSVDIDTLSLSWNAWKLAEKQLRVDTLFINHLQIKQLTELKTASSSGLSKELLSDFKYVTQHVHVQQVTINQINYDQHLKHAFTAANIQLKHTPTRGYVYSANLLNGDTQGTFSLTWNEVPIWFFKITANHLNPQLIAPNLPEQLSFVLEGKGEANNLNLQIQQFSGTVRNQAINGKLNVSLQNKKLNITDGKFTIANSEITVSGTLADRWNIDWSIRIPDLQAVSAKTKGALSSSGSISGPRLTPTLNAALQLNHLQTANASLGQLDGTVQVIFKPDSLSSFSVIANNVIVNNHAFKQLNLGITEQTTLVDDKYLSSFNISSDGQRYLNVLLSLPKDTTLENIHTQTFAAKITSTVQDIKTFSRYFPAAENPNGQIKGSLDISGTIDKPAASGLIMISNASLDLRKLGIKLNAINFQISGDQSRLLSYRGSLNINQNTATINGTTDLAKADFESQLSLKGNNLQVVNLPEYNIVVSPDLKVYFAKKQLSITGKIFIPKAEIKPIQFKDAVMMPEETVFVGKPITNASSILNSMPQMQVTLSLGDQIHINYQHLDAMLAGSILISKALNSSTITTGELYTTRGTYEAYDRILTIKKGRLLYTGNDLVNPGINLVATRQIQTVQLETSQKTQIYTGSENISVGVQVNGTLKKPVITLFSSASGVDQADILSYLVLGVPASQASEQKAQAILAATSALNIGGESSNSAFSNFTKSLQSGLGLTELNVETVQSFDPNADLNESNVSGNTSLVLGKKLTRNLSLHYSIGLFNPVSILNLRYQINKHFSLQTEASSIDTGGDVLYSIERD
jgi:translocation and assembly module TamB